ncbi:MULTISPECIES: TIGR03792 family protein [Planktothrix]|uniref:TIGR03792 family protein n=1 Tax=Planktothrix TaxID=54304 RepID=UPI00040AC6DA|nr:MULTISPECIES: TIGR03792 family protein [Planktothrix]
MVIEWLKFKVPTEQWELFIQKDEEVWTAGLKNFPGFLGKEVWLDVKNQEIVMVIRWESQEKLGSFPEKTIQEFDEKMGELKIPILESRTYQIRKFMH